MNIFSKSLFFCLKSLFLQPTLQAGGRMIGTAFCFNIIFNPKIEIMSNSTLYPEATLQINQERATLSPENIDAWRNFSKTVYKEGKLSEQTKQLIAIAVAHVTQCPYCIRSHTRHALRKGVTKEEIMEAIWIAAEMRAGAAVAHSAIAIDEMQHEP